MENIEAFKKEHSDLLLHHTFYDQTVLRGKFDYEVEYTIMQMKNFLYDVQHAREQNLDISVISHLTYNLNLQLSHCYHRAIEYNDATRLFLVGDLYQLNFDHLNEFQKQSTGIRELIDNLNEISLFEIYQSCLGDMFGNHYKNGLKIENKKLLNLEKELACMNGVQLLKCLVFLIDLTEKELIDIKDGLTYKPNDYLELVYDLNYVFYSDNYWVEEKDHFRSHVKRNELMDEVTPEGLANYYRHILHDFKTNEPGRIWERYSDEKVELAYELYRLPLSIKQWEYYFGNIFRLEELKRWINELRNPKQRSNDGNGAEVPQGEVNQKIVMIFTDKLLSADEPSHLYFLLLAMWARRLLQNKEIPAFVRMVGEAYPDLFNEERTIEKVIMSLQNMNGKADQYFDEFVKDQSSMIDYIDMMYPKKSNGERRRDCERAVTLANNLFLALK